MCEIIQGGTSSEVSLTCKTSGKPITESNDYGMYCEDLCDMDKDVAAKESIMGLMKMFQPAGE